MACQASALCDVRGKGANAIQRDEDVGNMIVELWRPSLSSRRSGRRDDDVLPLLRIVWHVFHPFRAIHKPRGSHARGRHTLAMVCSSLDATDQRKTAVTCDFARGIGFIAVAANKCATFSKTSALRDSLRFFPLGVEAPDACPAVLLRVGNLKLTIDLLACMNASGSPTSRLREASKRGHQANPA